MHSKDGKWVIVFNGCIYNYKELKNDLINKGKTFISNTDTEVIAEDFQCMAQNLLKSLMECLL